jgi:hypothetical protein
MEEGKWERTAALGGIAFVALNVVGSLLPGSPPGTDDTAAEIGKYFRDHDSALMIGQALSAFGTIGLAWWFGSLFRRMRAAEGGNPRLSVVALLGLALGGATAMASGAVTSAAAMRIDEIGDGGAQLLFALSMTMIGMSAFGVIVFLGAAAALNYRARVFPAWTNYLAWLAAAAFVVGGLSVASDSAAFGTIGFVGFLVWSVWIVAISLLMWRGTDAA